MTHDEKNQSNHPELTQILGLADKDIKRFFVFCFCFFGHTAQHAGSEFPNQRLNPCPLQWKCGVLTTGPPGKSRGH